MYRSAGKSLQPRNPAHPSVVLTVMDIAAASPPKTVLIALAICGTVLCAWIVLIGSRSERTDGRVSVIAVGVSGKWLAAGSADGRIVIWSRTAHDAPRQLTFAAGPLNDLQFSPDERTLAIASADLGLYDLTQAAPRVLRADRARYGCVRFSRDGQVLLVIAANGRIETLDARSGATRVRICCSTIYGDVAFTPTDDTIVNAGHWPRLWDTGTGQLVAPLTTDREIATFRPIAFDAAQGTIFMGSQDGRVYVWDLKTRERTAISPPQPGYVDALAVSRSGFVVFAAFGKSLQLWNPRTGQHRILGAARPTSNILVDPADERFIIFGTLEGAIESWDVAAERRIGALRIPSP